MLPATVGVLASDVWSALLQTAVVVVMEDEASDEAT